MEVEASSEREAKSKATKAGFNFFDSEITDLTAQKIIPSDPKSVIERLERWAKGDTCDGCPASDDTVFQAVDLLRKAFLDGDGPRTYVITETCPHCESEVEMVWNTEALGYKAFCPVCGKRLMLCDECRHSGGANCDYNGETDSCWRNPPKAAPVRKLWMRLGVMLKVEESEAEAILAGEQTQAQDALKIVLADGRFQPDGDSYIPGESVVSYNHAYGTNYDDGDVDFNI